MYCSILSEGGGGRGGQGELRFLQEYWHFLFRFYEFDKNVGITCPVSVRLIRDRERGATEALTLQRIEHVSIHLK